MLDVKRFLKTTLQAMPILSSADVQITHSFPKAPRRTFVFIGDAVTQRVEWMTNRSREEEFSITVGFSVSQVRPDGETAEDQLLQIAENFEEVLDQDPGLGGLAVTSHFYPKRLGSRAVDSYNEAYLETEVVVTCRP